MQPINKENQTLSPLSYSNGKRTRYRPANTPQWRYFKNCHLVKVTSRGKTIICKKDHSTWTNHLGIALPGVLANLPYFTCFYLGTNEPYSQYRLDAAVGMTCEWVGIFGFGGSAQAIKDRRDTMPLAVRKLHVFVAHVPACWAHGRSYEWIRCCIHAGRNGHVCNIWS